MPAGRANQQADYRVGRQRDRKRCPHRRSDARAVCWRPRGPGRVTIIDQLASNIRAIAIGELRPELRAMRSDEALLIHVDGKAFVVLAADAWCGVVEAASDHNALPL